MCTAKVKTKNVKFTHSLKERIVGSGFPRTSKNKIQNERAEAKTTQTTQAGHTTAYNERDQSGTRLEKVLVAEPSRVDSPRQCGNHTHNRVQVGARGAERHQERHVEAAVFDAGPRVAIELIADAKLHTRAGTMCPLLRMGRQACGRKQTLRECIKRKVLGDAQHTLITKLMLATVPHRDSCLIPAHTSSSYSSRTTSVRKDLVLAVGGKSPS